MHDKTYRLRSDSIEILPFKAIKAPVGDYGHYPERCKIVLPISQISLEFSGSFVIFTVPGWLREKKNLIGYFDIIQD